jgi:tetraprenyl-beta-curcumene synthase
MTPGSGVTHHERMARQASGRGTSAAATVALVRANARFWPTVFPDVRRELRRWDELAQAIPDGALREQALAKLRHERFNTEVAATLATLVSPVRRHHAVEAIVALEVMYDYLDGITEQPSPDPLADGHRLYRAFADATAPAGPFADYYGQQSRRDDGGYLASLAGTCRRGLWSLPAAPVVAPVAGAVLARCGEAQTRTHAVSRRGLGQLQAWAQGQPEIRALRWPEVAAGAAASVLAGHALIALAGDPAATGADAERIADAYMTTCALTTLLDSLIDAEADAVTGGHTYLAYYDDDAQVAERLGLLAREAVAAAAELPRAAHHLVTVAGAVAFYLSAPGGDRERAARLTAPVVDELGPLLESTLAIFAVWRGAKRRHERRASRGARGTEQVVGVVPALG